jgi:hypothetical protein
MNSWIKIKILNIFYKKWVKLKVFLENLDFYCSMRTEIINLIKALFIKFYLRNAALNWFKFYLNK